MRILLLLLLLLTPALAEVKDALRLDFRVKAALPTGQGKIRNIEMAPAVAVIVGEEAQIRVEGKDDCEVTLKVTPTLGPNDTVTLKLYVAAKFSGKEVNRNIQLTGLLGQPTSVEIDDERRGEKLSIEVTPTRYKAP